MAGHVTSSPEFDPDRTDEWVLRASALTIAPPTGGEVDEIAEATAGAERLAVEALSLLVLGVVTEQRCPSPCSLCAEGICALVRDLSAAFPEAFSDTVPPDGGDPVRALREYRAALADVGTAVSTCRRMLHTSGYCLFGEPEQDLCGRILVAAHRLG
jgi:hypothetical protein